MLHGVVNKGKQVMIQAKEKYYTDLVETQGELAMRGHLVGDELSDLLLVRGGQEEVGMFTVFEAE